MAEVIINMLLNCNWINILSAMLTPTIAIAGTIIAFLQYRNNYLKSKNDLFDKRYEFYKKLRTWWLSTANVDSQHYDLEMIDLIPWAEEASFLFEKDIQQHILSL